MSRNSAIVSLYEAICDFVMEVNTCNLNTRLRQEDGEVQANLGYITRSYLKTPKCKKSLPYLTQRPLPRS